MLRTVPGSDIEVRFLHPSNAPYELPELPILSKPAFKVTETNAVQFLNAPPPMVFIFPDIFTSVKAIHPSNADVPITSTEPQNMEVNLV